MTKSALLNIDVQRSFEHRPFWQEDDLPAFQHALGRLIDGCQTRGVPVIDVFHVNPEGPFSIGSGLVTPMTFLSHTPAKTVHKHVHNALLESGLDAWLRQQDITHLIIAGLRTEQCCETTTRVASDIGYKVTFVTEATMTFPMAHADGGVFSTAAIKRHTELVLADRFATITDVDGALAELDQAV
ncbi:cysteine hydrolase family protein [Ewingella americana]|jgi:nicotinamidase-related amidase|uniref:Isochorismatase family protein n=1 Tax=Ewingella americana TaxID=41202 RepID=A0A502G6P0_9GAMM|nr:isochorismatase family protein [Ewingella americana]TPG57060.1 isochorismatase family protein [Ewingella americana]